ncbi:hypothetical protein, partial [Rhodoferax sp.]|uniref:hypothetical protein n=1 Tax=Rhodoferax sp. TaxID=50421 RepID=UPI0028431241
MSQKFPSSFPERSLLLRVQFVIFPTSKLESCRSPEVASFLGCAALEQRLLSVATGSLLESQRRYQRTYQSFKASRSCVLTSSLAKLASMDVCA